MKFISIVRGALQKYVVKLDGKELGIFTIGENKICLMDKVDQTKSCVEITLNASISPTLSLDDYYYFTPTIYGGVCTVYKDEIFTLIDYIASFLNLPITELIDVSYKQTPNCKWGFSVTNRLYKGYSFYEKYKYSYKTFNKTFNLKEVQNERIPKDWFSSDLKSWLIRNNLTEHDSLKTAAGVLFNDCNQSHSTYDVDATQKSFSQKLQKKYNFPFSMVKETVKVPVRITLSNGSGEYKTIHFFRSKTSSKEKSRKQTQRTSSSTRKL